MLSRSRALVAPYLLHSDYLFLPIIFCAFTVGELHWCKSYGIKSASCTRFMSGKTSVKVVGAFDKHN